MLPEQARGPCTSRTQQEPILRIQNHPYAGRSYHATRDLPAQGIVIEASTPYTYTIWKQFRNEVCSECWRYEGGRRGFLTRKDDEDYPESREASREGTLRLQEKASVGAGLWFCDGLCQKQWLEREGLFMVQLLKTLEDARQKKDKGVRDVEIQPKDIEITTETIERMWGAIRQKEASPKEVRKWRDIQLDNFETDIARYVLLALVHMHRERHQSSQTYAQVQKATKVGTDSVDEAPKDRKDMREFGEATWDDFASLQPNELQHLGAYPELLDNQTRVYQVLKGRFGDERATNQSSTVPTIRNGGEEMARDGNARIIEHKSGGLRIRQENIAQLPDLGRVITIENVRTALSVDPGNSFGIWEVPLTDESECLGFAVYPKLSFFNHREFQKLVKCGRAPRRGFETALMWEQNRDTDHTFYLQIVCPTLARCVTDAHCDL
ncbi:uncharacterized protein FIBRA_04651 [Fibroporia radiculosa]|uniref:SET domain-containing protein n=1 Tax=Fibroporia radiculosa TaxID=599839 RepID=J4G7Q4_9APHY|nr:uncharacterized protein FIBRA_04651 [Fibroporia radiculosa]CCM02548.1 predicted protein [Fibroporia radiculosa]